MACLIDTVFTFLMNIQKLKPHGNKIEGYDISHVEKSLFNARPRMWEGHLRTEIINAINGKKNRGGNSISWEEMFWTNKDDAVNDPSKRKSYEFVDHFRDAPVN
jgi:hypothetical protein